MERAGQKNDSQCCRPHGLGDQVIKTLDARPTKPSGRPHVEGHDRSRSRLGVRAVPTISMIEAIDPPVPRHPMAGTVNAKVPRIRCT